MHYTYMNRYNIYTYIIDIRPSILLKTFFYDVSYIYMDRYVYTHMSQTCNDQHCKRFQLQFGKALNVFSSYLHIHSLIHSAPIHLVSLQCLQIFKLISIVYKCLPELISASSLQLYFLLPIHLLYSSHKFCMHYNLASYLKFGFSPCYHGNILPALLGETGTSLIQSNLS